MLFLVVRCSKIARQPVNCREKQLRIQNTIRVNEKKNAHTRPAHTQIRFIQKRANIGVYIQNWLLSPSSSSTTIVLFLFVVVVAVIMLHSNCSSATSSGTFNTFYFSVYMVYPFSHFATSTMHIDFSSLV